MTSEHFLPLACQDQTCFIKTLLLVFVSMSHVGEEKEEIRFVKQDAKTKEKN